MIWKGKLRAFNSTDYLATVEIAGSWGYTVADVPVSKGIDSAAMAVSSAVWIVGVDPSDTKSMCVVGVW